MRTWMSCVPVNHPSVPPAFSSMAASDLRMALLEQWGWRVRLAGKKPEEEKGRGMFTGP